MSLASIYLMSIKTEAQASAKDDDEKILILPPPQETLKNIVFTLVVMMVLDIVFIFYAIHCLVECSHAQSWPIWLTLLMFILLFVPGLGFSVSLGIIVYHLALGCGQPKLSFSFY